MLIYQIIIIISSISSVDHLFLILNSQRFNQLCNHRRPLIINYLHPVPSAIYSTTLLSCSSQHIFESLLVYHIINTQQLLLHIIVTSDLSEKAGVSNLLSLLKVGSPPQVFFSKLHITNNHTNCNYSNNDDRYRIYNYKKMMNCHLVVFQPFEIDASCIAYNICSVVLWLISYGFYGVCWVVGGCGRW